MKKLLLLASCASTLGLIWIGTANAADMPVKAVSTASVPLSYNWNGVFWGLNIGYGQTVGDSTIDGFSKSNSHSCELFKGKCLEFGKGGYGSISASSIPGSVSGDADGLTVGGQLGIRKQFNQFTLGGIVDWEWSTIKGNQSVAFGSTSTNFNSRITNIGTVVAELGWAPGSGATLLAIDGGFAWGTVKHSLTSTAGVSMANDSSTKAGWTLGAKLEHKLADSWTVWTGYRFVDLGKYSNTVSYTDGWNNYSNVVSGNNRVNEIRVGFHRALVLN